MVEMNDPVTHPSHYTSDRFPFECIEMTEGMGFNIGNMCKYVWRHLDKGQTSRGSEEGVVVPDARTGKMS